MAATLAAERLLIATDTRGVLDGSGRTLPEGRLRDYGSLPFGRGGMRDKIRRSWYAVEAGVHTYIFDGSSGASVREALAGRAPATRVVA